MSKRKYKPRKLKSMTDRLMTELAGVERFLADAEEVLAKHPADTWLAGSVRHYRRRRAQLQRLLGLHPD